MQALILAAGRGKRLGELTSKSTKCMLKLQGQRLIEYMLNGLNDVGIKRVIMVVGHGADELQTFLGSHYGHMSIQYVYNPCYSNMNNIYSVFLAADRLIADDTLLIESDLIVDRAILRDCIDEPAPTVAVVAKYESWMDGTVTTLRNDKFIARFISKPEQRPTEVSAYYKTVNIYKLSREFSQQCFVPQLVSEVERGGTHHYYERVLQQIVDSGDAQIKGMAVDGAFWYEIDTVEDLNASEALFASFTAQQ